MSELYELIVLSKNRIYALQRAVIFPAALRSPLNNRPVFDSALVEQCLVIVRSRVRVNGAPWVSNRKNPVVKQQARKEPKGDRQELLDALASLGLNTTAAQVDEALKRLPQAGAGMEEPERIRRVFLELRKQA